jgi:hypothetical protein
VAPTPSRTVGYEYHRRLVTRIVLLLDLTVSHCPTQWCHWAVTVGHRAVVGASSPSQPTGTVCVPRTRCQAGKLLRLPAFGRLRSEVLTERSPA